jgi:hypothetical protein
VLGLGFSGLIFLFCVIISVVLVVLSRSSKLMFE